MEQKANNPSERLLLANWRLMEASKKGGLTAVIEEASAIFSSPVILFDEHFKVIASCPKNPESIPELSCMLNNCSINDKSAYKLLKQHRIKNSNYYAPFYAKEGLCSGEPIILGELVHRERIYGHLVICPGTAEENEEDLRLVSLILHIIDLHFSAVTGSCDYREYALSLRLENLLSTGTPEHLLDASVNAIQEAVFGRFAVMVAPINNHAARYALVEASLHSLREKYKNIIVTFHSQAFVIIIGEIRYSAEAPIIRPENNVIVKELFEYFERYDINPGLSSSFSDLYLTHFYYRQALLCAKLSDELSLPERAVFLDLMPLPAFSVIAKANLGYTFIHPVFFQMKEYDDAYGTEYVRTFCAFLLNLKDKEKTAKELHVHKNTVQYRITRIEEIFNLPFDDGKTMLNLICSALLLKIDPKLCERPARKKAKK